MKDRSKYLLVASKEIPFTAIQGFNPLNFFVTKPGLRFEVEETPDRNWTYLTKKRTTKTEIKGGLEICESFRQKILKKANGLITLPSTIGCSYEPVKKPNAADVLRSNDLDEMFGPGYKFGADELCARIFQLISQQENGIAGLLSTTSSNFVLSEGHLVQLSYWSYCNQWKIEAQEYVNQRFYPECRLFMRKI